MSQKVLVIGDIMLDAFWVSTPKGISPEAPIISMEVRSIEYRLGGAGNVLLNLRSLLSPSSAEIIYIGKTSGTTEEMLISRGVKVYSTINKLSKSTIKNRIVVEEPYQQIIRFDEDEETKYYPEDEKYITQTMQKIGPFDICIVSDYNHGAVTKEIFSAARKNSAILITDPKKIYPRFYAGSDIITPNLKEFYAFKLDRPEDSIIEEKTRALLHHDLLHPILNHKATTFIALKKGAKGTSCYWTNYSGANQEPLSDKHFLAYRESPVIDTTGAGDTFIATLAAALILYSSNSQECKYLRAVNLANRMAGISTSYPGCFIPESELG